MRHQFGFPALDKRRGIARLPALLISMANTKSAAKRARQTGRRTLQNRRALTNVKNQVRQVRADIGAKTKDAAKTAYKEVVSTLDRAAKTGRIHRNAANRKKSRLNKALAALA